MSKSLQWLEANKTAINQWLKYFKFAGFVSVSTCADDISRRKYICNSWFSVNLKFASFDVYNGLFWVWQWCRARRYIFFFNCRSCQLRLKLKIGNCNSSTYHLTHKLKGRLNVSGKVFLINGTPQTSTLTADKKTGFISSKNTLI